MADQDGGPAFPGFVPNENGSLALLDRVPASGMSQHDYFAAHAPPMPEWWYDAARRARGNEDAGGRLSFHEELEIMVQWRWRYADEMLRNRDPHDA